VRPLVLLAAGLVAVAAAAVALAWPSGCPSGTVIVPAGASIQTYVNAATPGAKFCLSPGLYRMQTVVAKADQHFIGMPGAVLNGARLLRKFSREGRFWVAAGQRQEKELRGMCRPGYETCTDGTELSIDNHRLEQVATRDAVTFGRFFFDHAAGKIYLVDDPIGKRVEVSAANYAFTGPANGVVIRGLTVEKYYNTAQLGAINGAYTKGWRVENCDIRRNSGAGVTLGSDSQLLNSRLHDNGQIGATISGSNILLEGNDVWGNDTAGYDAGWEGGGIKVSGGKGIVFRNNRAHDNFGPGLWCDGDCDGVLFERNTASGNDGPGIFYEISRNAVIRDNVLRENNHDHAPWFWGAEIQIAASQDVDVYNNAVTVAPGGRSIMLIDQNRPNASGGYYQTRDNRVHDNTIVYLGSGAAGGISDAQPGAHNFAIIERGNNRFYRNSYSYPAAIPPVFVWGGEPADFAAFRAQGQDADGTISASR
jgi:parallel beta-helix repeat protein